MSCSLVRKGPAPLGDPTVEGLAAGRLPASVVDLSPGALHGIPLTASCLGGLSFLFFCRYVRVLFLARKGSQVGVAERVPALRLARKVAWLTAVVVNVFPVEIIVTETNCQGILRQSSQSSQHSNIPRADSVKTSRMSGDETFFVVSVTSPSIGEGLFISPFCPLPGGWPGAER